MFFSLTVFALLFASCSTDLLESAQPLQEHQTVSSRTSVEVSCEITSFEIIIDDLVVYFQSFDNDITGLVLEEVQSVEVVNLSTGLAESLNLNVKSSEIIIDDLVVYFEIPDEDFSNYELVMNQTLDF